MDRLEARLDEALREQKHVFVCGWDEGADEWSACAKWGAHHSLRDIVHMQDERAGGPLSRIEKEYLLEPQKIRIGIGRFGRDLLFVVIAGPDEDELIFTRDQLDRAREDCVSDSDEECWEDALKRMGAKLK
jgi:hypothetical protein